MGGNTPALSGTGASVFISLRANNPVFSTNVTIANAVIGAGGVLDILGRNFIVTNSFSNYGLLRLLGASGQIIPVISAAHGGVEYSGTGSLIGGLNYYNLIISGTYTAGGVLQVTHDLSNSGSLNIGSNNLVVAGTFTNAGTLTLTGLAGQSIPSFSSTQGTIYYSGATAVPVGGYNYYNLGISGTLDIGANNLNVAGVFTNNGVLKLTGIAGQIIPAISTTQGTVEFQNFISSLILGSSFYNLKIDGGSYTLSADKIFPAVYGALLLGPSLTINGAGHDLTFRAGAASLLCNIINVKLLTFTAMGSNNVTFTSNAGMSFDANTVKTNYRAILSRSVGSGTALDPMMIYSVSNAPGGLQYITTGGLGLYYKLANNVDAAETSGGSSFIRIGSLTNRFTGVFDGNGKTVSNLNMDIADDGVGLFAATGASAVIRNIGLVNTNVTAHYLLNGFLDIGRSFVGGLVGANDGTIENSYVTGSVSGYLGVGGLAGSNYGAIENSYFAGSIFGNRSYPGSEVGTNSTGGLVGENHGAISHAYATGSLVSGYHDYLYVGGLVGNNAGGTISDSWAGVNVSGYHGWGMGGLVGYNNAGTITRSYATGSVSANGANTGVGGLVGNNAGTITDAYATGNVAEASAGSAWDSVGIGYGGLVGINNNSITKSFSTGNVMLASGYGNYIGGLVGLNQGSFSNCFSTGNVEAYSNHNSDIGPLFGGDYWYAGPGVFYSSYSSGTAVNRIGGAWWVNSYGARASLAQLMNPAFDVYVAGGVAWDIYNPVWDVYTDSLPHLHFENHAGNSYSVWNGATSSNWLTPSNWAAGVTPGAGANIYITARPYNPVLEADINVAGITLGAGAVLDPGLFKVTGTNLDVFGTLLVRAGTFGGNYAFNGTSTLESGSTVNFAGIGTQGIDATAPGTFYNLAINNPGTVSLAQDVTVNNQLTLTQGTFAVGGQALTLNGPSIAGTPNNLLTTAASSLVFGGNAFNVNIPASVRLLNGLTINNIHNVTLNSYLDLNSRVNLLSGNLLLSLSADHIIGIHVVPSGLSVGMSELPIEVDEPESGYAPAAPIFPEDNGKMVGMPKLASVDDSAAIDQIITAAMNFRPMLFEDWVKLTPWGISSFRISQ